MFHSTSNDDAEEFPHMGNTSKSWEAKEIYSRGTEGTVKLILYAQLKGIIISGKLLILC